MKRKSVVEQLKKSLIQEKASVQTKLASLDSKIAKAEAVFSEKISENKSDIKNTVMKVKRDTFTFPESDYKIIETIINKAMSMTIKVNKSEVLRAGLLAISELHDDNLRSIISRVEKIKVGRPSKYKKSERMP